MIYKIFVFLIRFHATFIAITGISGIRREEKVFDIFARKLFIN